METTDTIDCYKILRIPPDATDAEIIKAAQRMRSIWNPDDFEEHKEVALCTLDDIDRAKRTLLDPESRRLHDAKLKEMFGENYAYMQRTVSITSNSGLSGSYSRPWIAESSTLNQVDSTASSDFANLNKANLPSASESNTTYAKAGSGSIIKSGYSPSEDDSEKPWGMVDLTPQFKSRFSSRVGSEASQSAMSFDYDSAGTYTRKGSGRPVSGSFESSISPVTKDIGLKGKDAESSARFGEEDASLLKEFDFDHLERDDLDKPRKTNSFDTLPALKKKMHEIEYSLDVPLSRLRQCISDTEVTVARLLALRNKKPMDTILELSERVIEACEKADKDYPEEKTPDETTRMDHLSSGYAGNIKSTHDGKEWMYGSKFKQVGESKEQERKKSKEQERRPSNNLNIPSPKESIQKERNIPTNLTDTSTSLNNESLVDNSGIITLEMNVYLDDVGSEATQDSSSSDGSHARRGSLSDRESYIYDRNRDSVTVGVSKMRSKAVNLEKALTCSSILKAEKSLGSDIVEDLENDYVVKGSVKAQYESSCQMLLSHSRLEGFSMSAKIEFGDGKEKGDVKLYLDEKLVLQIVDGVVRENEKSYLEPKSISGMPLCMVMIIHTNNFKLKILRFIGERRESIKIYKKDILFYKIENIYSDHRL